jgi:hypothetical protein
MKTASFQNVLFIFFKHWFMDRVQEVGGSELSVCLSSSRMYLAVKLPYKIGFHCVALKTALFDADIKVNNE